jgi:hypothetical protein
MADLPNVPAKRDLRCEAGDEKLVAGCWLLVAGLLPADSSTSNQ